MIDVIHGELTLSTAPETLAKGKRPMFADSVVVPWKGDGYIPKQFGYGCPIGHAETKGTPLPLSFQQIRTAWENGKSIRWP